MKVKDANQIVLGGTIVGRQETKKIVSIRIATDAFGGKSAFPTTIFYDKEKTEGFQVGDRVTLECHIQARRVIKSDGISKVYYQDIVGDNIALTKRALAEYLDDSVIQTTEGGYGDDINKAFIVGQIYHKYSPNPDIQILTIASRTRRTVDYIEVTCFKRQAELASLLSEDDYVAIVGSIRTSPNKKDERLTNESIVCKDIAAIPQV